MTTIDAWIAGLPKVELHVHLEGSMTPQTVGLLAARHGVDTETVWPGGLPERFSFDGFPDFAHQFLFGLQLLRGGDDLESVILALAADLARENVRYAEVTSTVSSHLGAGMAAEEYGQALTRGRRRAWSDHGVRLGWVIDIPRDLEAPGAHTTIDFLAGAHVPDGTVAIGLGGYEVGCPPEPFADDFARARALGLRSLPHAGETEGAASIRGALDALGAERIGHGVRCLEDPELVRRLRDEGITLEVCPTSNVLLGVCETIEGHPLRRLLDAGLAVTLNTDDPGMFASTLSGELQLAYDHHDLDWEGLRALQRHALAASSLDAPLRREIEAEIAAYPSRSPS